MAYGQGDTVVVGVVEVLLADTGETLPDLHSHPVRRVLCQLNWQRHSLSPASRQKFVPLAASLTAPAPRARVHCCAGVPLQSQLCVSARGFDHLHLYGGAVGKVGALDVEAFLGVPVRVQHRAGRRRRRRARGCGAALGRNEGYVSEDG